MAPEWHTMDCLAVLQLYPLKAYTVQGTGCAAEPHTEDRPSPDLGKGGGPPPHWAAQSNNFRGIALIMALTWETF